MTSCPIPYCRYQVAGPLRICRLHYRLVPRPQQDALAHYARSHKGGPAHVGAFEWLRGAVNRRRVVEGGDVKSGLFNPRRMTMEPELKQPVQFDYTKDTDVIRAFQLSGEHSVNQSLPMPNIIGLQRSANGAMRLQEIKLRYAMFKEKCKKTGGGMDIHMPFLDGPAVPSLPEQA